MRRFFSLFRQENTEQDASQASRRRPVSALQSGTPSTTQQDSVQSQPPTSPGVRLRPATNDHPTTPIATISDLTSTISDLTSSGPSQIDRARPRPSYTPLSHSMSGESRSTRLEASLHDQHVSDNHGEQEDMAGAEHFAVQNIQITRITASPMPSRPSFLSRMGSRFSRTPQNREAPIASTTRDPDLLHLTRRRLSPSSPSRRSNDGSVSGSFLSIVESFSQGSSTAPARSRRQRDLTSISRPLPMPAEGVEDRSNADASATPSDRSSPPSLEHSALNLATATSPSLGPRHRRLSRIRHSITLPFDNFFSSQTRSPTIPEMRISPPRPTRNSQHTVSNFTLPPLSISDSNIDVAEPRHIDSTTVVNEEDVQTRSNPTEGAARPPVRTESPSWTERLADRAAAGRREARRVPNMLRGRSSRLIRRDDEAPLPRMLQLAAATIAAQLSGIPDQTLSNIQAFGNDGADGNINNLFRSLRNGTGTTRPDGSDPTESDRPPHGSTVPPLNFLRVFRFVNENSRGMDAAAGTEPGAINQLDHGPGDNTDAIEAPDNRTVTLVMVGVRSVPSEHIGDDAMAAEPTLDAFLRLPHAVTNNLFRTSTGGLLRHADGRPRFPRRRRASMGGVNTFPANYDSQRHQRQPNSSRHSSIAVPSSVPATIANAPTPTESPPGPRPPPSTPADPYLSGSTTPNQRPSSASAMQHPPMPSRELAAQHLREAGIPSPDDQGIHGVHHRRRSDTEFTRQRDLGAGSTRRNGVVEPDTAAVAEAQATGSRSWLIYVIGTNLTEDHPALTTPTLFTDNPSYEDMLLLSSLLGPAKPPVASREDVDSAPGLYKVSDRNGHLVAAAHEDGNELSIANGEQCLVCLCGYESNEELRQLSKCSHLFHRECIDEWLTTGRNSCPLCRGQGVNETPNLASTSDSAATAGLSASDF